MRNNQLLHPGLIHVFPQHGVELVSPVLVEQIPVATTGQLSKEPRWLQIGFETTNDVIRIQASCVHGAGQRPSARARQHVDVDAILLKRLEHSKMSHAASCATSECQPDLDASQMMNDAFDPLLQ